MKASLFGQPLSRKRTPGSARRCGGTIVERLLGEDERSYAYEIVLGPLPVENYRSVLTVAAAESGSVVVWTSTFEPTADGAAEAVAGMYESGLAELAHRLVPECRQAPHLRASGSPLRFAVGALAVGLLSPKEANHHLPTLGRPRVQVVRQQSSGSTVAVEEGLLRALCLGIIHD